MANVRRFVLRVSQVFPVKDPVVEIGSYLVTGQHELANMRPFFKGKQYTGCDLRPGPGVDRIEDIQKLNFADDSVGTLLVLETLEHVRNPFEAFAEMRRVLAPGGILIVSVPFSLQIHEFPSDYWRYTPYCLDMLLEGLYRIIVWENPLIHYSLAEKLPLSVLAVASKQPMPDSFLRSMKAFCRSDRQHFMIKLGGDGN